MPSASRVICVLGMHRSGTSCLAGNLEESGLFLGRVQTQAADNKKGNRESPRILALHEDVLGWNGGRWDRPPRRVEWNDSHRRERDAIIAQFQIDAAGKAWGFKDPRALLILEGWREALPQLELVGIIRHPLAVAASLARRNSMTLDQGLRLWTHYNRALLKLLDEVGFPLLSFDVERGQFLSAVEVLVRRLGLTPPKSGLAFFEEELRHERGVDGALPSEVEGLHLELERRVGVV